MNFKHQLNLRLLQVRTHFARIYAAPDRWRRRRRATAHLGSHFSSAYVASLEDLQRSGFSLCSPSAAALNALLRDWQTLRGWHAANATNATNATSKSSSKVFFEELLPEQHLQQLTGFLSIALEEGLLRTVTEAMGMVPHLESIDVLASHQSGKDLAASQLWHYDINDRRIIKLFVYLEDCGPRHGPFTFIAADLSQRMAADVGHYVDDVRIATHVPRSEWRAVEGPAGTSFLIDTGRCYHMGSRCELTRYAYVVTFSSGLKFMKRADLWREVLGSQMRTLSPLQRAVCGLER